MMKPFIKIGSIFLFLLLGGYLLQAIEPSQEAYINFIDTHLKSFGMWGVISYIGLAGLLVCFAVPRQLISFVGGYAYGAALGTIYATLGTLLGCILSFFYARLVGQSFVQKHFGKRIKKMENFLGHNTFSMTLIIRLLPFGNNLATNMLTGVSKINPLSFFIGSFIGYIPQNFIFALLGKGIKVETYTQLIISAILLIIASTLGWYLYKKNKNAISEIEEQE